MFADAYRRLVTGEYDSAEEAIALSNTYFDGITKELEDAKDLVQKALAAAKKQDFPAATKHAKQAKELYTRAYAKVKKVPDWEGGSSRIGKTIHGLLPLAALAGLLTIIGAAISPVVGVAWGAGLTAGGLFGRKNLKKTYTNTNLTHDKKFTHENYDKTAALGEISLCIKDLDRIISAYSRKKNADQFDEGSINVRSQINASKKWYHRALY
jgi:hypothetical protein